MNKLVPREAITSKIYLIRGIKVMLDKDLAALYCVENRILIQAVKRNIERFPPDFMFQLSKEEFDSLRSQIVISKGKGGRRYPPYVFTEQGVAMLSSVINSKIAIQVNIQIMRAFTKLREMLSTHKDLARKIADLEKHLKDHDEHIQTIFEAIHQLMAPPEKSRKKIGFTVKERQPGYGKKPKKRKN